jgi:hypothetical protein
VLSCCRIVDHEVWNPRLQEAMLNGCQQVISQQAKKDVRLRPILQVMKIGRSINGPLRISKGIFQTYQRHVETSDFQISPAVVGLRSVFRT